MHFTAASSACVHFLLIHWRLETQLNKQPLTIAKDYWVLVHFTMHFTAASSACVHFLLIHCH